MWTYFMSDKTPLVSTLYIKSCLDDVVFFSYASLFPAFKIAPLLWTPWDTLFWECLWSSSITSLRNLEWKASTVRKSNSTDLMAYISSCTGPELAEGKFWILHLFVLIILIYLWLDCEKTALWIIWLNTDTVARGTFEHLCVTERYPETPSCTNNCEMTSLAGLCIRTTW